MTEWIEQDKKDENHLYVHLKDPSLLDLSIFDRMSNDDFWYAGHGIYLDSESLLWGL